MMSIFQIFDLFWVGCISPTALAAVTASTTWQALIMALVMGVALAAVGLAFLQVTFAELWAIILVPILNSLFRGAGNAKEVLTMLAMANPLVRAHWFRRGRWEEKEV